MNLKKVEKNRKKKIRFTTFKRFLKHTYRNLFIWKLSKEKKVFLVFAKVYVILDNEVDEALLSDSYIRSVYDLFNNNYNKSFLISVLSKKIKDQKGLIDLYNHLYSFYENSRILNYFSKKENKLKHFLLEENKIDNYTLLNRNLKFILNYLKEISPNLFNSIYRKILLLS